MSDFIPTIGIETHVQLKTKTKLFSAVSNDAREAPPNTLISHIDTGMPGALPVLNEKALELAARAAFALNTKSQKHSYFERKHYFYPDSPAGYQISQLDAPIIVGGYVDINIDGQNKRVGITRAQLEADAGKNTHPAGADYSLVDLNRAGTPLLEIVSEPDMHSAAEAKAYVRELYLLMKYADVSDADLYHGNMRFDVNVSLSNDPKKLGKRTEVKNLNSFRSVEAAVEYEIKRQSELLEKGEPVTQETRGWDEDKQKTSAQRTKEEAEDYRYMPEPDIPTIELNDNYIEKIRSVMPKLPNYWRELLTGLDISEKNIDLLLEAEIEDDRLSFLPLFEQKKDDKDFVQFYANWQLNVFLPLMRDGKFVPGERKSLVLEVAIYNMLKGRKLNSTKAKELFEGLIKLPNLPDDIEAYAEERGYVQVSDEGAIEEIVKQVIAENEKAAEDVRSGEARAIGFLVGQVMAKSKGQANPGLAQQIIKKRLGV